MSITTMGDKTQAFDFFQTPLSSHYPLPLSTEQKRTIFEQKFLKFLKGPKREMFVAGIFTENRSVWVGDLETRPKNLKSLCLGPYITLYFLGFLF
jgi:hypothetical protein